MRLGPGQVVLDDQGRPVAFRHGRLPGQGWPDWSDGAERTGMPALLAEARAPGRLVGPDGWVRRGSTDATSDPRLYNTPWLVDLLVLEHGHGGRLDHLELAGCGGDLPAHEASYEQSIVAPLVSPLSLAHRR
jgi:hypothetical protein